jgi:hypothetical protein
VTRKEFRANVMEMGVVAHVLDVDLFFDTLDSDGGGELDLDEVKRAFTQLLAAAANREKEVQQATKDLEKKRRAVARQHSAVAAAKPAEEE